VDTLLGHPLHDLLGHVNAHAVIDPPPGQNHFRMVADGLGFMGEVVGIDADTVATHQARPEGQKIPFTPAGSFKNPPKGELEALSFKL
jgi:hypothetical protein